MAGANSAPAWEVTAQREDYQVGQNGQLTQGMVVTFRTRSGAVGSVFVEQAQYTPEKVRQVVAAKAGDMEAVQGMTG